MITILVRVRIQDLPTFISVFATRGAALRQQHGSQAAQLFRNPEAADEVMVLFDWSSREDFERFTQDPVVKATMQASGTAGPPAFTFLERVAAFPA